MTSLGGLLVLARNSCAFSRFNRPVIRKFGLSAKNSSGLIWPVQTLPVHVGCPLRDGNYAYEIYDVGYIDTLDAQTRRIPKDVVKKARNVVFLGNEHFLDDMEMLSQLQTNLLKPLTDSNCRVIVPFLSGSRHTIKQGSSVLQFQDHLLVDRLAFLMNFVALKHLERVDLVIGHSMASFLALALKVNDSKTRAVALINPIPGNSAPRWIKPGRLSMAMVQWSNRFLTFPLALPWLAWTRLVMGGELMGARFGLRAQRNFLKMCHGIDYDTTQSTALTVEMLDTPLLYVGCRDDPVVDRREEEAYMRLLNLKESDFRSCNEGFGVSGPETTGPRKSRGVRLPGSSHFPFRDRGSSDVIVRELLELLDSSPPVDDGSGPR